ncbi:cathepsin B-like [Tetranychus urticae]|uniref:Peptidase C1A papain C-terminal domain-containing protein n=1 Tax=Tetranychus urticae TaxID=32264 RepID=T1JR13_TETUR|nr:cathepsin B-like [Tetranychus urticae]
MKLFLIATLFVYSLSAQEYTYSDLEPLTDEIIDAINALNTTWKAGINLNGSSSVRMDDLVSTQNDLNYTQDAQTDVYPAMKLSVNFDAREAWPNCTSIGKIYDQRKGYPSWIYTAVGTIADRLCIKHGVQIDVEATVEHMIKSNVGSNSYNNSANIGQALKYWAKNGVFTVESVKESSCLPFSQKCQPNEIKLNRYFAVTNNYVNYEDKIMSSITLDGPISAYMAVYSDFLSYKSGVYKRLSDRYLGVQNIKIIGWGTENGVDYFLAVNSWGTAWGEKGFFKFQRGTQQLGHAPVPMFPSLEPVDIVQDIPKSYVHGQLFYLTK